MYRSLLSVLLLGLVPVTGVPDDGASAIQHLEIAPTALPVEITGDISASGAIIIDMGSGQKVYERYANMRRPIASLTKLMTALLIVENHSMDETVTIPRGVADTVGNVAYLPEGERFSVGELLSALLIRSANDAAKALAVYHSGSIAAFVEEMNERAASLGLQATSYSNPIGLDDPRNWSTPQELAWLGMFVQRYPEIASRMSRRGERIYGNKGTEIFLTHTHALLHADTPVIAGKTGTTDAAGQCLLSVVEYGGRSYLVVLLHSAQRYKDMQVILAAMNPEEPGLDVTALHVK